MAKNKSNKRNQAKGTQPKGRKPLSRVIVYLILIAVVFGIYSAFPTLGGAPSMKVVIDSYGNVCRYISEDDFNYTASVQDLVTIPKDEAKVKVYSPSKGQGIIYLIDYGTLDVKKFPTAGAPTVGQMQYESGYVPESYPCLGYTLNGWYKTRTADGKKGYVYKDAVIWDVIDSF